MNTKETVMTQPETEATTVVSRRSERGSALLITMMVSVILTLLGLAFLTLSGQENQIAVNEREAKQVLYMAQAGAKIAAEWFQSPLPNDPVTLKNNDGFVPKRGEMVFASIYNVKYKGGESGTDDTGNILFDRPFRGVPKDTFRGTEDNPDLRISTGSNYLARLNAVLDNGRNVDNSNAPWKWGTIRLTDIRVFSPPMIDGNRYGLATIRATATKFNTQGKELSTRTVYVTLNEVKFPRPTGPIDAKGSIDVKGASFVHWGDVRSYDTLDPSGQGNNWVPTGFPWDGPEHPARFDAYSDPTSANDVANHRWRALQGYEGAAGNARGKDLWLRVRSAAELDPYQSTGAGNPGGMPCNDLSPATWTDRITVPKSVWTYRCTDPDDQRQIFGWTSVYTTWYDLSTRNVTMKKGSNMFRWDSTFELTEMKYDVWKRIAKGRGKNIHYMVWDTATSAWKQDGVGTAKSMGAWCNLYTTVGGVGKIDGKKAGVWFFDTITRTNPQPCVQASTKDNCGGKLEDTNMLGGAVPGGFVYSNVMEQKPGGGETVNVQMPGESKDFAWKDVNAHMKYNNQDYFWVYQPQATPCSMYTASGTNLTAQCNHMVQQGYTMPSGATINVPADIIKEMDESWDMSGTWMFLDVSDGYAIKGTKDSSQFRMDEDIAKPFVNFNFANVQGNCCDDANNKNYDIVVGGKQQLDQDTVNELQTKFQAMGLTAGVDLDGPAVPLRDTKFYGIVYNEGSWDWQSGGNLFGAIILGNDYGAAGNAEIWFDERIIKDEWPPKDWRLPRVRPASWKAE